MKKDLGFIELLLMLGVAFGLVAGVCSRHGIPWWEAFWLCSASAIISTVGIVAHQYRNHK